MPYPETISENSPPLEHIFFLRIYKSKLNVSLRLSFRSRLLYFIIHTNLQLMRAFSNRSLPTAIHN